MNPPSNPSTPLPQDLRSADSALAANVQVDLPEADFQPTTSTTGPHQAPRTTGPHQTPD